MTTKKNDSRPRNTKNSKGQNFIGSKGFMALIVIIGLLACGFGTASAEQTVKDEKTILAIHDATDGYNKKHCDVDSKEHCGDVQSEVLMTVGNFWVKHTGKKNGFFDSEYNAKETIEFSVDFINKVNAQEGKISPGENMIFKSKDGKSGIEVIYGEHIDSPFIIRMQNGRELVVRIIKKTLENIEEAHFSKDKLFNSIWDFKNLNGFIMGAKDSNILYYWAIMDSNDQQILELASSAEEELDFSISELIYSFVCIMRYQVGLPIRPLTNWNAVKPAYMHVDLLSNIADISPTAEWKPIEDINGEQQDIINQNILKIRYNCKILGNDLKCTGDPSIKVINKRIEAIRDRFIIGFSEFMGNVVHVFGTSKDIVESKNSTFHKGVTSHNFWA